MKVWLVSRHLGTLAWARAAGLVWDEAVSHLPDVAAVQPGDRVYGTLPLHLAAEVCAAGAEYWHLVLRLPQNARGLERSAAELEALGGRFVRFEVTKIGGDE